MNQFRNKLRVKIVDDEHPCHGKEGRVVRLRMADNGAWINMNEEVPDDFRSFPVSDEAGRRNHLLLYPEQCEEVIEKPQPDR